MEDEIISILDECIKVKDGIKDLTLIIAEISEEIVNAYKNKKKVVLFGNGGSAADAQHIAAEFVGKFYKDRESLRRRGPRSTNTTRRRARGHGDTIRCHRWSWCQAGQNCRQDGPTVRIRH